MRATLELKGTQCRCKNLAISSYSHKDNMPKVSHYNTVYLKIYAPVLYEMFVYKHTETIEYVKN